MKKAVYVGIVTQELKDNDYDVPVDVQLVNTINTDDGVKASVVLPNGKLINVPHSGIIVNVDESEDLQIING